MATVLTVLVSLIVGIGVLLLAALCVPLRIGGRIDGIELHEDADRAPENADGTTWHGQASWLFGAVRLTTRGGAGQKPVTQWLLLGFRHNLPQTRSDRKPAQRDDECATRREGAVRKFSGKVWKRILRRRRRRRRGTTPDVPVSALIRVVRSELPWLLRALCKGLSLHLRGRLVYGLFDPAMTGMSQGLLALLPVPADLRLVPDYEYARLSGSVAGRATVFPIRLVGLFVRAAFRPAVRRLWWPRLRAKLRRFRPAVANVA